MDEKKIGKDIILVIASNLVKMLGSILTIFIIPKLFNIQDYGFYKLYLLYLSYAAMLHFGLIDGIYLFFAGKQFDELPKNDMRLYVRFLFIQQMIVVFLIVGFSFFVTGPRKAIVLYLAINVILINLTGLFQQISQITERFKEFAFINILTAIFNVCIILIFYIFKISSFTKFIAATTFLSIIILIWYMWIYRSIVFGEHTKGRKGKTEIKLFFKIGIPLLLSNIIVIFMSSIPKQLVEIFFPIEQFPQVFSEFSFAFTLLGFTSVFLSAIGIVIFPILKKNSAEKLASVYHNLSSFLIVGIFAALSLYVPVQYIVERFLTDYSNSLLTFFIICPSIVFTSLVTIVQQNYYKTMNKNGTFLVNGIISLVIMIGSILIAHFFINDSINVIAVIFVVSMIIWYLINEIFLVKKMDLKFSKKYIYLLVTTILFYSMSLFTNQLLKLGFYIIISIVGITVFYGKDILKIVKSFPIRNKTNEQ